MKLALIVGAATVLASTLTGCVVAPYPEPVVYAPPPPAVIVRPVYRPHYYHHYGHRPHWRGHRHR